MTVRERGKVDLVQYGRVIGIVGMCVAVSGYFYWRHENAERARVHFLTEYRECFLPLSEVPRQQPELDAHLQRCADFCRSDRAWGIDNQFAVPDNRRLICSNTAMKLVGFHDKTQVKVPPKDVWTTGCEFSGTTPEACARQFRTIQASRHLRELTSDPRKRGSKRNPE